ncbi:MAG TPA: hypothetical protein VF077_05825 [Nitrospiraceae bacterium]
MTLYIENLKNPKVRFKVISYDKETGVGTLEGEYGARFTRPLGKEQLSRFGYKVVKVEEPTDEGDKPAPKKAKAG